MIDIKNIKKQFGNLQVLRGITEHIDQGEKIAVIGPSGSGKSTFLRCLNLLEVPTEGEIWFEGVNMTDVNVDIDSMRRRMGMVSWTERGMSKPSRSCLSAFCRVLINVQSLLHG